MRSSLAAKRLPALHSDIFQNQCAMPTSKMQPAARYRISMEIIRANIGKALHGREPAGEAGARELFGKVLKQRRSAADRGHYRQGRLRGKARVGLEPQRS